MTEPWRNIDGEPLEPSQVAADWCALYFRACMTKADAAGESPNAPGLYLTAARECELLDAKRASGTRSKCWDPMPRKMPRHAASRRTP